ncbi:swarming motility protein SwrAA [Metabacillus malikii]|uniref:Core-binding (CB) domain-containing protein n=1 Tax=Metabacillus malikii TaxID=1504265 RepID=A0ABT9ZMM6_9BACI|nr:swarming motility protein SwrAA [Metabacillus malikii]MDQ0233547.1 hypothetical protein [Metabacillus malikii]
MKKSSYHREKVFEHLLKEISERNAYGEGVAHTSKWIQLFCRYLANYTTVKEVTDIDSEVVRLYFSYLVQNHKRLQLSLTDIKRSLQMIHDVLQIEIDQDFSLSNTRLWNNLK